MKNLNIKDGIKYFAGTLAVSGMLLLGGCDNNTNSTANEQGTGDDYPTRTEGEDREIGQPSRDNLSRENVNTRLYDDNGEEREVEANEDETDANEVINERQRTQQRGNLERANEDTVSNEDEPLDQRDNQPGSASEGEPVRDL